LYLLFLTRRSSNLCSVTTIAFIGHLPVSSSCLQGSRSTLCPKTGYRTETDRSKSWPRPPRCEMRNGRAMSVSYKNSKRAGDGELSGRNDSENTGAKLRVLRRSG